MPIGIYIRTKEHNRNNSESHKGINKGIKFSDEHRKNISISKIKFYSSHPKQMGINTSNYKGGRRIDTQGYVLVLCPEHPFKITGNYVYEHRLVMEKHLGRYLKPTEIVHHINGNPTDNRIENLMLFSNSAKHIKFHHDL